MQTFLPYPSFEGSASVLHMKHLGKQRVENLQIMRALLLDRGWIHHPATNMWRGYESSLLAYQEAIVQEWVARGYKDTCLDKTVDLYFRHSGRRGHMATPHWLGDRQFHISHQSNLLRKKPEWYGNYFPNVPDDLPYVWPEPLYSVKEIDMAKHDGTITIEDARVIFKNFAGKAKTFNAAGDRNFSVIIPPEMVDDLREDGWNVKFLKPREEGDEPAAHLKVIVKYSPKSRPPRIVLISSHGRTELDEETVESLDYAYMKQVDLIIRPYNYDVNGKTGITAYLKTMFVTIEEDELEEKYGMMDHQEPREYDDDDE